MAESQEIELELPEEEVDIHEADVIQESAQDVNFSAEEETSNEDELNEYSDGVKKRIDKLTYRMREAERQREEAVKLAKQMAEQNAQLQTKLQSSDSTLVNEYATRVESQKEQARKALKEAQELGDAEAIALATEAVAKTSLEEQNAQRLKQRQQRPAAQQPQQGAQQPQQQNLQPAPVDPRAEEWAEENPWFGENEGMTYAAMGIHQKLLGEGVPPNTKHYYQRVDSEMRELFPQQFADETKNVKSPVAGASRGVGSAKKGSRSVKLTPSQIAIAKRVGVPLEEYAKYV
jgi:predicted phage tail protein|tara:strand:+ start:10095 stop:10964 length:870 start_codon:yes stop_codon:yes gene_type:complete